jgi:uncharacterized membrane protein
MFDTLDQPKQAAPGDLVLAHNKGAFPSLIRFGQWLRPSWRKWKKWNHAAIVTSTTDGISCVQMGRRGQLVKLADVAPRGYTTIVPCPTNVDKVKAVDYALRQVGVKYSVATIFSIALNILTPSWLRFDFRRQGTALICSALVARAWEHGGWDVPGDFDPYQVSPAQLAMWTGAN